jgi:transcriptional regulator
MTVLTMKDTNRARLEKCASDAFDKAEEALKRLDQIEQPIQQSLKCGVAHAILVQAHLVGDLRARTFLGRLRWLLLGR